VSNLLSIVIPSHNRTDLLICAIESIISDQSFGDDCSICISDNSLTDETSHEIQKNYSDDIRIQYRRSLDSPSLDENINTAVSMSNSEYVWIFGDDDLMIKDSLTDILNILKTHRHSLLIVNSQTFSNSTTIEHNRNSLSYDKEYDVSNNDEFMIDMAGYLTYAPCIIVKKGDWISSYNSADVGTFFAHLNAVMKIKLSSMAYYLASPSIKMRLHSQTWTEHHFKIWNIYYPKIIWDAEGYSDKAKLQVVRKNPLQSMFSTLSSRAYGRYDFSIFKDTVVNSNNCSLLYKVMHLFIVLTPTVLLKNLYYLLIKSGIKKRSANFSPDLALALLRKA